MRFWKVVRLVGLLVVVTIITPAFAGVPQGKTLLLVESVSPELPGMAAPRGNGSVLYTPHDGTFEAAFSLATQEDVEFVQFWPFPSSEGTLLAFEACFYSLSVSTVVNFQFEFVYYSASTAGEEAEPATLRENRESPVFDIPANTVTCQPIIFEAQGDPGVDVRDPAGEGRKR